MKQINTKYLESLYPCSDRLDNWKLYNDAFEGTLLEFLDLENITHSDKLWVFFRSIDKKVIPLVAANFAERVIYVYESNYPNDLRPRKAIEAAKSLDMSTSDKRDAALTAALAAARAADDATDAAYAVARAAAYATDSARAAARAAYATDAARAAAYAAYAAYAARATDAAYAAARAAAYATYAAARADNRNLEEKAQIEIIKGYLNV